MEKEIGPRSIVVGGINIGLKHKVNLRTLNEVVLKEYRLT